MTALLGVGEVRAAADRIAGYALRTPLVRSPRPGLWLKLECDQRSGSFKARGAYAALTVLPPQVRARGVVTHSSGNHGRALAEAAAALGCPVTVVVPDTAPPYKVAAVRATGAVVEVVPAADREARAGEHVRAGAVLVPPFDHDDVIAGQATVGAEVAGQAEDLGLQVLRVLAPVGGGGLVSGIAVALTGSAVAVTGVEPELAADLAEGLRTGQRVTWPVERTSRTVADGLRLPAVGRRPWVHILALGVSAATVSEEEILAAQTWLAQTGVVAEPSGAVAVAAALRLPPAADPTTAVVAVVSGGNVGPGAGTSTLDSDPRE